jgi:hypothetical protein
MVTPTIRQYVESRLFEWVMATSMVSLAVEIFFFPRILGATSFNLLTDLIPGQFIAAFLFFFGIVRIGALIANGRSIVHGPRIRAIAAIAGAVLWAQFAFSLIVEFYDAPPSPGIPFWTTFVLAELYSAYRASHDVRN